MIEYATDSNPLRADDFLTTADDVRRPKYKDSAEAEAEKQRENKRREQ